MVGIAKLVRASLTRHDAEAREYESLYQITNVATTEGPTSILLASGFPQLGTSYVGQGGEYDNYALVTGYSNITHKNYDANRTVYLGTVHYSTDARKYRRPAENHENPLNKPVAISGGGRRRKVLATEKRFQTFDNLDVVNTAGGLLPNESLMVDDGNNTLRMTKNYAPADFSLETLADFTDAVNDTVFWGGALRTWKMEPAQWRLVYGAIPYYEVTYEFLKRDATWDLKPANVGEFDKDNATFKREEQVIDGFHPLDVNGNFLDDLNAQVPIYFNGEGANPDAFRWYWEKDFGELGLPTEQPS